MEMSAKTKHIEVPFIHAILFLRWNRLCCIFVLKFICCSSTLIHFMLRCFTLNKRSFRLCIWKFVVCVAGVQLFLNTFLACRFPFREIYRLKYWFWQCLQGTWRPLLPSSSLTFKDPSRTLKFIPFAQGFLGRGRVSSSIFGHDLFLGLPVSKPMIERHLFQKHTCNVVPKVVISFCTKNI